MFWSNGLLSFDPCISYKCQKLAYKASEWEGANMWICTNSTYICARHGQKVPNSVEYKASRKHGRTLPLWQPWEDTNRSGMMVLRLLFWEQLVQSDPSWQWCRDRPSELNSHQMIWRQIDNWLVSTVLYCTWDLK